jgi:eukaryotic-like serine/threonine-protein kinase
MVPRQTALRRDDPAEIDRYRLLGRIAEGGQGVVYLAQRGSGTPVALKLLRADWLANPSARDRLAREVAAARRVAPFCTAQVLDARLDGEAPYVVSEYVDGPSLAEHIRTAGPVRGAALDRLAIGTVTALAAIHQANVVHRDFKPGNVVLGPDGPRVIDFGIARDLDVDPTRTTGGVGTPAYMAPEQLTEGPVGPPVDMFAWAATMVYTATGRLPFPATALPTLMHQILHAEPDLDGVPGPLADELSRCLAKEPERRPTAQAVLLSLLGRPVPAGQVTVAAETLAQAARLTAPGVPGTTTGAAHTRADDTRPAGDAHPAGAAAVGPATRWTTAGLVRWLRRPVGLATTAVVALATTLGVGWLLAGGPLDRTAGAGPTPTSTDRPVATPGDSGRPRPPAAGGGPPATGTIPVPFIGRWTGTADQPKGTPKRWKAVVEFAPNSSHGRMEDNTNKCVDRLTVTRPAPTETELHLYQHNISGKTGDCAAAGTLRLIVNGVGGLDMFWKDLSDGSNTATAVLTRRDDKG